MIINCVQGGKLRPKAPLISDLFKVTPFNCCQLWFGNAPNIGMRVPYLLVEDLRPTHNDGHDSVNVFSELFTKQRQLYVHF